MGISVDSPNSHQAFQEKQTGMLEYPLCSDFYPHAAVAKEYGILREGPPLPGVSERAVIIVDKNGRIAFRKVYELGEVPDVDEVLDALQKIQKQAGRAARQ